MQLTPNGSWRGVHYKIQVNSKDIKNNEPGKFREWKWFSKEELENVYENIFLVDQYAVDVFL